VFTIYEQAIMMKVKLMTPFGRLVVLLFGIFALWTFAAYYSRDSLLLNSALVVATILMAGFVAYQAFLTRKSIEEIRKDRMNIEFIKNEIVGYIHLVERKLESNLTEAHPQGLAGDEIPPYLSKRDYEDLDYDIITLLDYYRNITLQEIGMKLRIHDKIQKLLKNYDIDLKRYNELVRKINTDTAEIIKKLETDEVLVNLISQKSKEMSEKLNKKRIPRSKDVIQELVFKFKEDITKMDIPTYEKLGLDKKVDQEYRSDLWENAKKIFVEHLRNNDVQVYNKLIEREKDMEKLKLMSKPLLEKVRKMKGELLRSEEILEEKLMRL